MSSFPLIAEIRQKQPNWRAVKFKTTAEVQLGKMLQPKQERPEDTKEPYLRAANLSWSGVNLSDVQEMWVSPFEKSKYDLRAGDVLVSEGGDVGRSSYLAEDLPGIYFQNAINRVRAGKESDGRFLYYWLNVVKNSGWLEILCNRATIAHFTADKLRETEIILPPLPTQRRIAAYLDRETARIDALVAEKEALLRLLEEKRASLISHAVTRGLNPKAKLKPSGIPWLGDVQEHWEVKELRYLVDPTRQVMYGIVLPGPHVEGGVPIIKGGDVRPHRLNPATLSRTTPEIAEKHARSAVREGDILFSIRGSIGDVAVVPAELHGANITQDAARIAPREGIDRDWLYWALQSGYAYSSLEVGSLGAAVRGINIRDLKRLWLPVPPIAEQQQIGKVLTAQIGNTKSLESDIQTSIQLLREKRTSLISTAVTGEMAVD